MAAVTTFWKPQSRAAEKKVRVKDTERLWRLTRQAVLVRDGYRCRACRSRTAVDAHHIRFRSLGGDVFDTSNVCALCRSCHADIHAYRLTVVGPHYDANGKLKFQVEAGR